jgi:hypothetical protein
VNGVMNFGFSNMREISGLAGNMLAFQEKPCSMVLSYLVS